MPKLAAMDINDENGLVGRVKSWPQDVKSFYTGVRTEMKKVTSPSLKGVRATTAVVVITVFLFGLYFWLIDNVIGRFIDWLLRYLAHKG
jgi:preprotein translocase subunit SecE